MQTVTYYSALEMLGELKRLGYPGVHIQTITRTTRGDLYTTFTFEVALTTLSVVNVSHACIIRLHSFSLPTTSPSPGHPALRKWVNNSAIARDLLSEAAEKMGLAVYHGYVSNDANGVSVECELWEFNGHDELEARL